MRKSLRKQKKPNQKKLDLNKVNQVLDIGAEVWKGVLKEEGNIFTPQQVDELLEREHGIQIVFMALKACVCGENYGTIRLT